MELTLRPWQRVVRANGHRYIVGTMDNGRIFHATLRGWAAIGRGELRRAGVTRTKETQTHGEWSVVAQTEFLV